MKASKKQSKPQARGRSLHPVVRRPTRVGWYWVSDDECKTWQPCIVYKYKNRFWGRNFDRGMWPLAKSAGLRWGGQIYPPNPGLQGTGHLVDRTLQGVVGERMQ